MSISRRSTDVREVRRRGPGADDEDARPPLPDDLWAFLVGYLVLLPFYLAPLWMARFVPGTETPFYLNLADLLGRAGTGHPSQAIYEVKLRLAPYVAPYLFYAQAGQLFSLATAHKLLMSLYVAALPLSLGRLYGTCQRSRLPALLSFPLAYNLAFAQGLVGFLVGLPLLFLFLAQVADNLDDEHDDDEPEWLWPFIRDGLLCVLAGALFLCSLELFAFGLCAAVLFILLSQAPMVYRVRTGLCFLPALGMVAWWRLVSLFAEEPPLPTAALEQLLAQRLQEVGTLDGAHAIKDALMRLSALPHSVLMGFTDGSHRQMVLALLGALALFVFIGTVAVFARGGERRLARFVGAGFFVLGFTLLVYWALPLEMPKLGVATLGPRFAVVAAALLGLFVPAWLKRLPRWGLCVVAGPTLVLCGWHGVGLAQHFARHGKEIADFGAVLDQVPKGGKAVGLVFEPKSKVVHAGLAGLPHYYPAVRGDGFVAPVACDLTLSPCKIKEPGQLPPDPGPLSPQRFDPGRAVPYFDYFIVHAGPAPGRLFQGQAGYIEKLASAGAWTVYRKKPGAVVPPPPEPQPKAAEPAPDQAQPKAPGPVRRAKRRR